MFRVLGSQLPEGREVSREKLGRGRRIGTGYQIVKKKGKVKEGINSRLRHPEGGGDSCNQDLYVSTVKRRLGRREEVGGSGRKTIKGRGKEHDE